MAYKLNDTMRVIGIEKYKDTIEFQKVNSQVINIKNERIYIERERPNRKRTADAKAIKRQMRKPSKLDTIF